MREILSQSGVEVRSKYNPARVGRTLGAISDEDGETQVKVSFNGEGTRWVLIDELELAINDLDETTIVSQGRFSPSRLLRRVLTSVQLSGDLSEMIYSLDMTNTEFMPHQFKPLLALLDSPSRGVLIADEVGLGKTIEAGLIWTELRFRTNANTLLVVCPAMLTEKWKLELARRFGTSATVMKPAELLEWLEAPSQQAQSRAIICSMQGMRPPRGWDDDKEKEVSRKPSARLARKLEELQDTPLFDLTVVDEAHYLRNEETSSAVLGRLLRPVSEHFVLLSATPVNTRSDDLFNLVSLVDPNQFQFRRQFEDVLQANRPLVLAANLLKSADCTAGEVAERLAEAEAGWLLEDSEGLKDLRQEIDALPESQALTPGDRVAFSERLQRINLLGHAIVRSRKREVFEKRVKRKVYYREAVMTAAESALYRLVSEAIISYAMGHAGVEGFLLAMPQQQMSSCMYAAAKHWKVGLYDPAAEEELAFEALGDIGERDSRPVSQFVESAIRGRVNMDALRADDSKFNLLLEILREQERQSPGEKVLVFSFFRDTLAYLKQRLEEVGFPCTIVQGGDDKQATIDGFRDDPTRRVLLATEVAAEGVDLQFMRLLVNYDLPWNPMRVEQRIGRIDRIGQKAEAIAVFNLVYGDTIDSRILARLFQRLKLFEESIGSTEDIVGGAINELTQHLLSASLSEQEQEEALQQAWFAIEQRKRDLAQVEESESDLIGLGDYVRDRVIRAHDRRRTISDADLLAHIQDYLDSEAPGYQLRLNGGEQICGELKLPAALAADLMHYRESHRLQRSRLEGGHTEPILVRNHVDAGGSPGRFELINQFHPLVRMIADGSKPPGGTILHALEVASAALHAPVPAGDYAFCAEAWRFTGVRQESTIRSAFVSLVDGTPLPAEDAFDLLNAMRASGRDWVRAADELSEPKLVVEKIDGARRQLERARRRELERHRTENADRARIQRQSIIRNRDHRVMQIEHAIRGHQAAGRANLEKADRARQERIREQAGVQLARIDSREQMASSEISLVAGVVRVKA